MILSLSFIYLLKKLFFKVSDSYLMSMFWTAEMR